MCSNVYFKIPIYEGFLLVTYLKSARLRALNGLTGNKKGKIFEGK